MALFLFALGGAVTGARRWHERLTMTELDPVEIAEQEIEREAAQKAAQQLEAKREIDDLVWMMGNKRGRRVVWRLLENAGVYRLSYVQGDALGTAFNEGNRNQGQRLLALIQEHASEGYGLMVQERKNV